LARYAESLCEPEVFGGKFMPDIPIACTLNSGELAGRKERLSRLSPDVIERVELENGVSLRFKMTPELLVELAQIIGQEHECCRFLSFVLAVEAGAELVRLDVTGPSGTKEFLRELMPPISA
jgi:hypothetical protein